MLTAVCKPKGVVVHLVRVNGKLITRIAYGGTVNWSICLWVHYQLQVHCFTTVYACCCCCLVYNNIHKKLSCRKETARRSILFRKNHVFNYK